jgi:hypothetical protein
MKGYLASVPFISNIKKNICLNSSYKTYNTLLHGRQQADESENLEHLPGRKQTTRNASYCHPEGMSPRSGPFSQTAEIQWQVHTRVIQPGEFSR